MIEKLYLNKLCLDYYKNERPLLLKFTGRNKIIREINYFVFYSIPDLTIRFSEFGGHPHEIFIKECNLDKLKWI